MGKVQQCLLKFLLATHFECQGDFEQRSQGDQKVAEDHKIEPEVLHRFDVPPSQFFVIAAFEELVGILQRGGSLTGW